MANSYSGGDRRPEKVSAMLPQMIKRGTGGTRLTRLFPLMTY
jgi:hypothetical protein